MIYIYIYIYIYIVLAHSSYHIRGDAASRLHYLLLYLLLGEDQQMSEGSH